MPSVSPASKHETRANKLFNNILFAQRLPTAAAMSWPESLLPAVDNNGTHNIVLLPGEGLWAKPLQKLTIVVQSEVHVSKHHIFLKLHSKQTVEC